MLLSAGILSARNSNSFLLQNNKQSQSVTPSVLKDNILRLDMITAMDIGLGPGISYEKIIREDKKIGIVLPVTLLLEEDDAYYPIYNYQTPSAPRYFSYLYLTPGLKFYPVGQNNITYAFGPNLMLGFGGGRGTMFNYRDPDDPMGGGPESFDVKKTVFRFGFLFNNYLNFQITPQFNLGITGGLGIVYYDYTFFTRYTDGTKMNQSSPMSSTGQFSLSIGYRF